MKNDDEGEIPDFSEDEIAAMEAAMDRIVERSAKLSADEDRGSSVAAPVGIALAQVEASGVALSDEVRERVRDIMKEKFRDGA